MDKSLFFDQNIEAVDIESEVKVSYLSYAMSVIVGRAIPDVRDGLKPVHRRILFSLHETGTFHNQAYKKSARIVGDVIGKYHPHGDMAVYDAIARLAQDFSLRYPLVDGQGNFGSIDGDPPAAARYTEVRMAALTEELLKDLDKDTVDFFPNYDGSLKEPAVLPTKIPNLLVNGTSGIAVGMATNIPPHNLGEVLEAVIFLIDNKEATLDELLKIVKGPDFPTGGIAYRSDELLQAYRTGKGSVLMRAKTLIEVDKKGNQKIIVKEIPYTVNKSTLVEKIAQLVHDKKIEGISNLRDESDRDGMRIVIELKKEMPPQLLLNKLFKLTPMELNFGITFLAIADGKPKQLTLLEMLRFFLSHRREVVLRRCKFELKKCEARAHILEGLRKALDCIDEVVALIKSSASVPEANKRLQERLGLTEIQAKAILDMQLQRLTSLERDKIDREYEELIRQIAYLREVIANPRLVDEIIRKELSEVKEKYDNGRRTEILLGKLEEGSWEDYVKEEQFVIVYTGSGYVKRTPLSSCTPRNRNTQGQKGIEVRDEDGVRALFCASSHDYLIVFTNQGRAYWIRTIDIPETGMAAKGRPLINFINLQPDERVASLINVRNFTDPKSLLFVTKNGITKRTALNEFSNPRSAGIIAAGLNEGDEVKDVTLLESGKEEVVLYTRKGKVLRFDVSQVREMGRNAAGVIGIRMADEDSVLGARKVIPEGFLFLVTEKALCKKSGLDLFRGYSRGSMGVRGIHLTEKGGDVVEGEVVLENDEVIAITEKGQLLRIQSNQVKPKGRDTQGVLLFQLTKEEDRVISLSKVSSEALEDGNS